MFGHVSDESEVQEFLGLVTDELLGERILDPDFSRGSRLALEVECDAFRESLKLFVLRGRGGRKETNAVDDMSVSHCHGAISPRDSRVIGVQSVNFEEDRVEDGDEMVRDDQAFDGVVGAGDVDFDEGGPVRAYLCFPKTGDWLCGGSDARRTYRQSTCRHHSE